VRGRFEEFLRWTVEVEYPAHARFLPEGEREAFGDYYKNLPKPGDAAALARMLRGTWRGDSGWTARWIKPFIRSCASSCSLPATRGAMTGQADRAGARLRQWYATGWRLLVMRRRYRRADRRIPAPAGQGVGWPHGRT